MDNIDKLRAAVDTVLGVLRQHGFTPGHIMNDDDDEWEPFLANPADEIMDVENCWVTFRSASRERKGGWIRFIPDVSCPCDLICDHSMPSDGHFTAAVDAAIKAIEEES